jgi:hypothetical protein
MTEAPKSLLAFKNDRISQSPDWTSLRVPDGMEDEEAKEAELAARESKSRLEDHIRGLFTNYNVVRAKMGSNV